MKQLSLELSKEILPTCTSTFYNTIHLTKEEKQSVEEKMTKQEERILAIFVHKDTPLTPFDVEAYYNRLYSPIPITSVRRAITNLTTKNKLQKCSKEQGMKIGNYGKPNHFWVVVK